MNGLVDRYLVRLLFLKSASTEISQKYKVSSALDFFLQRFEKGIDIFVVAFVVGPGADPLRCHQLRALQSCEIKRCGGLREARALLDDTDAHAYRFWVDFLLGKDCPGILEPIEDGKARRVRQCFQGFVDVNSHEFFETCFFRYLDIFLIRASNWKASP